MGVGLLKRFAHDAGLDEPDMSNNRALAQVAPSQNNKETTIDDQAGQLDAGLTDKVDVALTGTTSPLVLSDAQALRCIVLKLTGKHARRYSQFFDLIPMMEFLIEK